MAAWLGRRGITWRERLAVVSGRLMGPGGGRTSGGTHGGIGGVEEGSEMAGAEEALGGGQSRGETTLGGRTGGHRQGAAAPSYPRRPDHASWTQSTGFSFGKSIREIHNFLPFCI
jgi:hypothetical protein